MPLQFNQVFVGTGPTLVATVGPGPFNMQITLAGGTGSTIFLGTSNRVTVTNGAHVNGGVAWTLSGYATTPQTQLFAVAAGGSISTGVAISTPQ